MSFKGAPRGYKAFTSPRTKEVYVKEPLMDEYIHLSKEKHSKKG